MDNRNHTIVQGISTLSRYAEIRGASSEVEYNFGRAFHQLGTLWRSLELADTDRVGLLHLAVPRYQRVLELAKDNKDAGRGFDMAREAAYNLGLIYPTSGSPHLARELYRTWLVV